MKIKARIFIYVTECDTKFKIFKCIESVDGIKLYRKQIKEFVFVNKEDMSKAWKKTYQYCMNYITKYKIEWRWQ